MDTPQLPPRMTEIVGLLATVDAAQARLAQLVAEAEASGEVATATGLGLQTWLGTHGRMARSDRLTLLGVTDRLAAMPATGAAWRQGLLSWSQVRIICRAARHLSAVRARVVDEAIAAAVHEYSAYEPDELLWRVDQVIHDLDDRPLEAAERAAVADEFVAVQPRLDGTGGRLTAEFGAEHFALVSDTLTRRARPHLTGLPSAKAPDGSPDPRAAEMSSRSLAAARARGLLDLCRDDAAGGPAGRAAVPEVAVTVELDTLLDRARMPATILTTLAGGRLSLTSTATRRLLDQRGCDLRLVIIDEVGQAIGHGRRRRFARGWLADLVAVLDPTCCFPGCTTAGRVCQIDHGTDWKRGGHTDLDDLANVCAAHHTGKTHGHWDRTTLPGGTRRWRHRPTGTTVDVPPATRTLHPDRARTDAVRYRPRRTAPDSGTDPPQ